ncbi:MAG: carbohydrate-binding protein, partial [Ruminococcus sp.]|nr:carbohydrate-binding protein [Ruminococcus sp.]
CLGSLDNVGSGVNFAGTAGFRDYQDLSYNIKTIEGVHDLYLKFTGGDGYLLNADSFVFSKNPAPISSNFFKNVTVADTAYPLGWSIGTSAGKGSIIFGDRDFTITELPESLNNAEILMTACDAKNSNDDIATFTAGEDITLYVALDSRVENLPAWLSGYDKTSLVINTSNELIMEIYAKDVKAGEKVTLGSNGQSAYCVNYTVLATKPATIKEINGDIDGDGKLAVNDLVLINKHLLAVSPLTAEQCIKADLNSDGIIDVFDLVLLRKLFLK